MFVPQSLNTHQVANLLTEVADPRGRCNARGLQRSTIYLLALQIGAAITLSTLSIAPDSALVLLINVAFCWVGFTLVSKRLHDIGRSAWWFAAGVGIWLAYTLALCAGTMAIFGLNALDEGTTARVIMLSATIIPLFALLVWLHVVPGDAGENRFGPAPDARGFAMPASTSVDPVGAVPKLA
jgi:uncharacterized membrane protein YhaH (DUF805 family)